MWDPSAVVFELDEDATQAPIVTLIARTPAGDLHVMAELVAFGPDRVEVRGAHTFGPAALALGVRACAPSPAPSWSRSMSRSLSLRARLEQLARTPAAPRPRSATAESAPASFVLWATGRELPRSVDVARQLIAAGLPPRAAHAVLTKLAASLA